MKNLKRVVIAVLLFIPLFSWADQTICPPTYLNGNQRTCITLKTVATSGLASDVTGTLPATSLPNPSASTLGGVESIAAVSHQWINAISTSGVPAQSQPAFTDVSGSLASTQLPAHLTATGGSAPAIVAGTGCAATPGNCTVSMTTGSTDSFGQINVTASTSPSTAAVVATMTFNVAWGTAAFCVISPSNATAALLSGASLVFTGNTPTTATFTINSGASALVSGSQYKWNYNCGASS